MFYLEGSCFSYWPEVSLRDKLENGGSHIYELRSYNLKPGTMVEWANYWAKAIRMRDYKNTEAFMGTFSQVGDLYNVKHIWYVYLGGFFVMI